MCQGHEILNNLAFVVKGEKPGHDGRESHDSQDGEVQSQSESKSKASGCPTPVPPGPGAGPVDLSPSTDPDAEPLPLPSETSSQADLRYERMRILEELDQDLR